MRKWMASLTLVAILGSAGCYTMRSVTIDDLSAEKGRRVWVKHADQSELLVNDAQVFRGNLVGFVEGKYRELAPGDLRQMRVRKLAAGKTMGLVAAGVAGIAVTFVLVSGSQDHFDDCIGSDACDEGEQTPP
jgi:hypothetical protein